jgi:hypothetical protein
MENPSTVLRCWVGVSLPDVMAKINHVSEVVVPVVSGRLKAERAT